MNYIFKYMHMLIFNFKLMLFYITHISVVTLQQHIWKNRERSNIFLATDFSCYQSIALIYFYLPGPVDT